VKISVSQIVKSASLVAIGAIIGISLYYSTIIYNQHGAIVAKGVSSNGLKSIRVGMAPNEIIDLIGPPLCIKYSNSKMTENVIFSAGNGRDTHNNESEMWIYARPSKMSFGGIEINLFVKDGRLSSAYVENYDLGIYKCDSEECPSIWKETEFYTIDSIKETAFHSF